DGQVHVATFSANGKTVLTVDDHAVRLWNTATGRPEADPIKHDSDLSTMRVSPDRRTLLLASLNGAMQLWEVGTGRLAQSISHPAGLWGNGASFSLDGKTLATADKDRKVRLWDVAAGKLLGPPIELKDRPWSVAFSPDGNALVAGTEGKVAR